jgi:predicted RNase H-like HicB family nuclease
MANRVFVDTSFVLALINERDQYHKQAEALSFKFEESFLVLVMKLRLIVEKDPETGRYSSVFPELPGCASAGDTEDEAIANAREALELWFEPTD